MEPPSNETREREAPQPHASLLVIEGDTARTVQLDREILFGRAPDCSVQIADEAASRHHARILSHNGGWEIHDLHSHNGTFVNHVRVSKSIRLEAGDLISIGGVLVVVHSLGDPPRFERTVPWPRFTATLEEALAVALRTGASLAVVSFHLSNPKAAEGVILRALEQALNAGDVGATASPVDFAVLLSDAGEPLGKAGQLLAMLSEFDLEARAGVAIFPRDGTRADVLLLAAREAARTADPGQLAQHGDLCEVTQGNRQLIIADPATRSLYALLKRLALSTVNVLITGETGAGKENAAFALHHHSRRSDGPFIALNCASLTDTLAESELFGHERGAFTGAVSSRAGVFEAANRGTLFLDEVGELSAIAQAKLLRTLDTVTVTRVGSTKPFEVDVRVVAATHRNLVEDVASGRFRKDLFFRLAAAVVAIPALRARPVELALLARLFLREACSREGRPLMQISADAMNALQQHEWPGNVRELKNTIEVAVASTPSGVVELEHLPPHISGDAAQARRDPGRSVARLPLSQELEQLETRRIVEALALTGGRQTEAADFLGMPRRTLVFKLRRLRAHGADRA